MLVGRAEERRRIDGLLADARAGRSGALLLVGDPGVGKTALLEEALEGAEGLRVLRATGFELEADLAFAGLGALLRPLAEGIAGLPPPQAAALGGALGLGPPVPPGDRFTAYAGALTLVATAAEQTPLVLAVDDAQWLDPASLDALAFAARRLAADGIAVLMAAREVPPAALEHAEGVALLRVEGLPDEAARALARREAGAALAQEVAGTLAHETRGNPLALIEAVGALSPDQMAGRAPLPDPLPVGRDVVRALTARLEPLSPDTRRGLLIAAAGAGDPPLVADALRAEGLRGALEPAERAGLVTLGPAEIAFRHPLVRSSAYLAPDPAERRAAHGALAEAARRQGEAGVEALARHLAATAEGPDAEAAAALEAAGRRAAARIGYAEGAEALRRAARLTAVGEARAARLVEAATLGMMAGRADLSRECLDEAIREAGDPVLNAAARGARAHLEMMTGSARQARGMLVAEAERLGPAGGPATAVMLIDAVHASGMTGNATRALELARMAEARLEGAPRAVVVQVALGRVAAAFVAGEPDASERLERTPDPMEALVGGDPLAWTRVVLFLGPLIWADRFAEAESLAERLIGTVRALSAPSMLAYPLLARADLRTVTGDWEGAYADASEALEFAEQTSQRLMAAVAQIYLARVLAGRGEQECRALIAAALERTPRHNAGTLVAYADAYLGLLELGLGRFDAALVALERTYERCRAAGMRAHPPVPYLPDLVEAAVRGGRHAVAARGLALLEAQAEGASSRTLGALERCRGLVAGDAGVAIRHLARAVELEERAGSPFDRARSQLLLGERLRSARQRAEAVDALGAALATFEALGAAPWAERAATGLAALGARPRARRVPPGRELTAQELQIARAASSGLTNREIASQFFLSVKTVEFHLRNVFGKLGLRSRTELAARLRTSLGEAG